MDKDTYFVAVKALLRNGRDLLITHDIYGQWDLPGGRLRSDDFDASLDAVLERKLREELGDDFRYALRAPSVFFRHERSEHSLDGQRVRIFAVGFEADFLGGSIELGPHHDQYLWVDAATFSADDYFVDGWLKGLRTYQQRLRSSSDAAPAS